MGRIVTAIKAQKRNKDRVSVYLDGEYAFGLARIVAAWLHVGQELSEEKITQLTAQDEVEAAYARSLRLLSQRDHTTTEIRQYLKRHELAEPVIDDVIGRLERANLINDERFAQNWIENRSEFRPRSRRALAYELRAPVASRPRHSKKLLGRPMKRRWLTGRAGSNLPNTSI